MKFPYVTQEDAKRIDKELSRQGMSLALRTTDDNLVIILKARDGQIEIPVYLAESD